MILFVLQIKKKSERQVIKLRKWRKKTQLLLVTTHRQPHKNTLKVEHDYVANLITTKGFQVHSFIPC